ncbi:TraB/GumN family protein [Roseivirga pacifica]|uniref:TraB/GumN family protein n=1 Tax=Roseivirga pacifica TaxID=1267423 RepID=UPI003BB177AB
MLKCAFALFSLLSFSVLAQHTEGTLLFKVSHPDSDQTSYLFGTHHAFSKSFFEQQTEAILALENAEILIKENLTIAGKGSKEIINARFENTVWEKFLNKKDLIYMRSLFANSDTDFNKMHPAEVASFLHRKLSIMACDTRSATDPDLTLDDYIEDYAKSLDIPLIGLETVAEQLEIIQKDIEGMPPKVHKKRLSALIEQHQNNGQGYGCAATELYATKGFDFTYDQPCSNTLMLTDRNKKWMETIETKLKEANCFIAVGLSHLMFECGLISQLRGMGYNVEPVL